MDNKNEQTFLVGPNLTYKERKCEKNGPKHNMVNVKVLIVLS